jgi:Domain of unknown function (DUF4252)
MKNTNNMKNPLAFLLIFGASTLMGQSNSYQTMKDTFKDGDDVHAFSVSGFLARTVLRMADEHEFSDAITEVKSIKFIIVPKGEFSAKRLSLNGFKKVLKEDSFQELANVRDSGDDVTFFVQENGKKSDRYFILVDGRDEVVAVEMTGDIDMDKVMKLKGGIANSGPVKNF